MALFNHPIDLRQTPEYAGYMQTIGWQTYKNEGGFNYFVKKFTPFSFSFIKIYRPPAVISFKIVKNLVKKHRALWVKIAPQVYSDKNSVVVFSPPKIYRFLRPNKLLLDIDPYIPTKTIWLNLAPEEKQLLANMKPKTRYNIKKSKSYNLKSKIISGDKLEKKQIHCLYRLWKNNNQKNKLYTPRINELIHLINSFGNKCFVVQVSLTPGVKNEKIPGVDKLLAFSLILTSPNMSFYWHNASTQLGKKLFAPTLCLWEAIKQSKQLKKKVFDFEGIYDERYHRTFKNWQGFTRFKMGFI